MKAPPINHVVTRRLAVGFTGVASTSLAGWIMSTTLDHHTDGKVNGDKSKSCVHEITLMSWTSCTRVQRGSFDLFPVNKTSTESFVQNEANPYTNLTDQATSGAPKDLTEFDFVILGHGNAGKSAVETLKQHCPGATIALVDPLRPPSLSDRKSQNPKLKYYVQPALAFHPPTRTVELTDCKLKYKHGVLVATGSRGAPPPMALLDQKCLNRVLELRPTEVVGSTKRPVLPPETIRQISLMSASQGAKICIMGSGWEAIELAVAAAKRGKSQPPLLTFGNAGPLCHVIPRYLSSAVTKRLRRQGIDVQERSLVRYVAHHEGWSKRAAPRMEVHTAKSFDLLDTQRTLVDLLIVAPYVDGPRGTAVLPSLDPPKDLEEFGFGRTWYQSWSQLSSPATVPSTVVCYSDDGRISVNAELSAASKVYAAGSAAKYPNSATGHAHVAGEGSVDGALAGRLAALHMAREYQERSQSILSTSRVDMIEPESFAARSFPTFRSDICPYNSDEMKQSSLSQVGINALVVGLCDSEKMSTHGFWWTNVAEKRHHGDSQNRGRRTKRSDDNPIYGTGIVFYLDGTGTIRGIMTWGMPFTERGSMKMNSTLLERMISVIDTNGGITKGASKNDPLLTENHLAEESKRLAHIAFAGQRRITRRLTDKAEKMTKPLHRYTAAKPPTVTSIGLLKRQDQAVFSELLGENIYIRDDNDYKEEGELRPPNLLYIYPMHNARRDLHDEEEWKNPYLLSRDDRMDLAWAENERRARPPKEEPLWLRRGEALRGVNFQDAMNESMINNMRNGRFADGTEPYQRAKVPKVVQEASSKLRRWAGNAEEDDKPEDDGESQ